MVGVECRRCHLPAGASNVHGEQLSASCPRCRRSLSPLRFDGGTVLRCDDCAGAFVTPADWSEMLDDEAARAAVLSQMVPPLPGRGYDVPQLAEFVACPVCHKQMDRYAFAALTNIVIDACTPHGIWFDGRELGAVLRRITARERAEARGEVDEADERDERIWNAHIEKAKETIAEKSKPPVLPDDMRLNTLLSILVSTTLKR